MATKDPAKRLAAQRRHRAKRHAEKFGPGAGDQRGRHENHARGEKNARWNNGRMRTSQGYIAIAVADDHHLRQAHGYAYEHDLVAEEMLGRQLKPDEVVHHRNGKRDDNRLENLEVMTRSDHAREHGGFAGARDSRGRFRAKASRSPREFPKEAP